MKRQRRADPASVGLTCCQLHVPARDPFALNSVSIKPPLEVLSRQPAGSSSTPYVQHSLAHTRFTVKQTTVSAATKNKLRAGAEKAQKERSERKIVQLDSDPSLVKRGGKGKVGATKGKGKASAAAASAAAATASPAAAVPSHLRQEAGTASKPGSPSSRGTSPGDSRFGRMGTPSGLGRSGSRDPSAIPIRTRVLQLLALGPAKASDVAHRVRAPEEEVVQILQDVSSSFLSGRTPWLPCPLVRFVARVVASPLPLPPLHWDISDLIRVFPGRPRPQSSDGNVEAPERILSPSRHPRLEAVLGYRPSERHRSSFAGVRSARHCQARA